jgi:hypothetical protein
LWTLRVEVLGITSRPDEAWILQIGRNLIDTKSGVLCGKVYQQRFAELDEPDQLAVVTGFATANKKPLE